MLTSPPRYVLAPSPFCLFCPSQLSSAHLFCERYPDPPSSVRSATTLPSEVESATAPKMEGAPASVRGLTTRVIEATPLSFW